MKKTVQLISLLVLLLPFVMHSQITKKVEETRGLMPGDAVQLFTAKDQNDSLFVLAEALKKGPVVIVFYRGQWCPICNRHLSALQDSLSFIESKGAMVIAISPENQSNLNKTVDKTGAEFTLIYDENYEICYAFDVLFEPKKGVINKYNLFLGADLEESHGSENVMLPVPATFIINQEGNVIWRQFEHDHKERSTISEILNQL